MLTVYGGGWSIPILWSLLINQTEMLPRQDCREARNFGEEIGLSGNTLPHVILRIQGKLLVRIMDLSSDSVICSKRSLL